MKLHCREVHVLLEAFHDETAPGDSAASVEEHLARCAACRAAARRQGLNKILRAGARAPIPEPSDFFMSRLQGALQDSPPPRPAPALAELLARSGLRLAPAMAAMALVVSVGSARLSAPYDDTPVKVPAEELLLDDHPLSTDLLLAAIHGESIER
jgi:hypothetical protein